VPDSPIEPVQAEAVPMLPVRDRLFEAATENAILKLWVGHRAHPARIVDALNSRPDVRANPALQVTRDGVRAVIDRYEAEEAQAARPELRARRRRHLEHIYSLIERAAAEGWGNQVEKLVRLAAEIDGVIPTGRAVGRGAQQQLAGSTPTAEGDDPRDLSSWFRRLAERDRTADVVGTDAARAIGDVADAMGAAVDMATAARKREVAS